MSTAACLLVLGMPAAAVETIDLVSGSGEGLVARDTSANLDWLQLTQTKGLTYDGVVGGAGGWYPAGWRHATASEVCGLMSSLGLAPSPCPGSTPFVTGDQVSAHISFLGQTGCSGAAGGTCGMYDDGDSTNGVGSAEARRFASNWSRVEVAADRWPSDAVNSQVGHFQWPLPSWVERQHGSLGGGRYLV